MSWREKYGWSHVSPAERLLLFLATVLLVICIVMEVQTYQIQRTNDDSHRIVRQATSGPTVDAQRAAFAEFLVRQKSMEERQQRIEQYVCGGPCPDVTMPFTPGG